MTTAYDIQESASMAFAKALNAVQNIAKTQVADTGRYTYSYADLGDVLDEAKRVCQMFGLSLYQVPTVTIDGMLAVHLRLIHAEGDIMEFEPLVMKLPNEAQAYGSALTYARRYQLLTVFGIAPEDDDGAAATKEVRAPQMYGGYRTGAEQRIRKVMDELPPSDAKALRDAFRDEFRCGLSDLPVSRHAEALTWVMEHTGLELSDEEPY